MINLYSHNKVAYEKVLLDWKTTNRTCVVHATGTGKSLIIVKIIQENPKAKCLFLAPNIFILNQIKKHLKKSYTNVHFNTYQYFLKNDVDDFLNYSFIFLDEFHRVGAPEWNKNIVDILNNNPQAKILGTTATHIRYLDDNRDMAEELFNNSISSYIDLGTAIEKGIHKKPKYVSAIYNVSEIIEDTIVNLRRYKKDKEIEKIQSKRILWEKSNGIDFIINKYLSFERKKMLVFCKSKEHLDEIENLIKPILTKFYNENVEFHTVFSMIGQSKNIKTLNHLKKTELPQVIFSVDMLNEGIHVDGVDTIMMFRDTVSPIIYFQQLGRAFLSGQEKEPLIFDFVNNFNIKNSLNNLTSEFYNDFNQKNENDFFVKERNLVIDYYDEVLDFEQFIEEFKINTWEERYQELKQFIKNNNRLPKRKESCWLSNQKDSYKKGKLSEEKIQLLLKVVPNFLKERKMLPWEECFQELKQFIKNNNRLPKNNEYRWLANQRQYYKNGYLTKEQIQLLSEIDPDFLKEKKIPTWEENYQELKLLLKKNKKINSNKIFRWLSHQKQCYKNGKLSEKQIQLLLELDPEMFESKKLPWEKRYHELKLFIQENKRLPIVQEFSWLSSQKRNYKKGKLSEEQIQMLSEVDPDFLKEKKIPTWEENYQELKLLLEKNKKINSNKIVRWLTHQKQCYKNGKLSEKQIQLLLELDPDIFESKKLPWEKRYQELKLFIQENKRLPIVQEFSWLNHQKQCYKNGKLSEEQIQLLLELDPDFLKEKTILTWEESYQEVKQFIHKNKRLPKFNESYWLANQRQYYKNGYLRKEQIQLLLELNPDIFENKKNTWEEYYQELKQFIQENKRLPKSKETSWLSSQKQKYKNGKLSEEKIQLLLKVVPNFLKERKMLPWEECFQELKQFIKNNNRLPKNNEYRWLANQRQYYKRKKLSEEQIQLLLELDPNIFENKRNTWEECYEELKLFIQENKRLPTPKELYWFTTQKINYKNGKLSEEQIQLLLDLDPDIFKKSKRF